jgi:hypothetical protein
LAELPAAVRAFVDVSPGTLTTDALGERILALGLLIRQAQAAQAAAVRAFDLRGGADAAGAASTACWLRERAGAADREARSLLGLGRSLDRFPVMAAAFREGAVSAAHVRVLAAQARHLDDKTVAAGEAFLVESARRFDAVRFSVIVRRWVATVSAHAFEHDTERRYDARWLSLSRTFGGMASVQGMFEPEGAALLEAALDAMLSANPAGDARTRDKQRADALVDLVELARSHDLLPISGGARPEVLVHTSAAALAGLPALAGALGVAGLGDDPTGDRLAGSPRGSGLSGGSRGSGGSGGPDPRRGIDGWPPELDRAGPLTPGAFDRYTCDARFRRLVLDPAGIPLDLGRATRCVPPSLRKFVALRDGGCRYPDCPRPSAYCEAHHVVHWRHGGATSADNLALLCRYHHHLVHDRGHDLKLLPDGTVKVTQPYGRVVTSRPRGPTAVPVL